MLGDKISNSLAKTKLANVAHVFLDYLLVPYKIRDHFLTDNGFQFVSTFFGKLCRFFGLRYLTRVVYHP